MKKLKILVVLMCVISLILPVSWAEEELAGLTLAYTKLMHDTVADNEMTGHFLVDRIIQTIRTGRDELTTQEAELFADRGVTLFLTFNLGTGEKVASTDFLEVDEVYEENVEQRVAYVWSEDNYRNHTFFQNNPDVKADLEKFISDNYPEYSLDERFWDCIEIAKDENGEYQVKLAIVKGEESEDDSTSIECFYEFTEHSDHPYNESHLYAELVPDKRELKGKESLYSLGEEIGLFGKTCLCQTRYYKKCTKHLRKIKHEYTYWTKDFQAYDTIEMWPCDCEKRNYSYECPNGCTFKPHTGTWEEEIKEPGCGKTVTTGMDRTFSDITISLNGFKVGKNENEKLDTMEKIYTTSKESWITDAWKITEINNAHYDAAKGAPYGIITVSSNCCQKCKETFRIYFGKSDPKEEFVNLTVKVTPNTTGTVTIKGLMDTNGDNKSEQSTVTIPSEKTMKVKSGYPYEITSTGNAGYVYQHLVTEDGNEISDKSPYTYIMPPVDSKIIAHFVPDKDPNNDTGYTLWVTSNEGGRGYIQKAPDGTIYETFTGINGNKDVITEKITNVKAGTEFTLKYEEKEGYEFSRWEYRPYVGERAVYNTNDVKINMPKSNLVATAIFVKKAPIINETNPILKVTVNNEEWGTAHAIVGGVPIKLSEVTPGTEYEIVYDAEDGYYFTNWGYDSVDSPIIDGQTGIIKMPNYDLEVKAFFAPIPPQDEPLRSGNIEFVAETITPGDGIWPGTVPENLYDIAAGGTVTIAQTPNSGYEFVKWYITDKDGELITPTLEYNDFGSGYFIMPDYDVVAHAVYKKVEKSTLTVYIIGEGTVENEETNIPSGGIITVTIGETVELVATPEDGWEFRGWVDEEGNLISSEKILEYQVNGDTVIYAVFTEKNYYTLYVSSMEGGNAYTNGNENHPEKDVIKTTDDLGKTVYKIENVLEGERFTIYYDNVKQGFTFDKWEYKPYIKAEKDVRNKKDGRIEILMPASDLTVTAVFKNDNIVEKPELRVTTNNEKWGTAWTFVGKEKTKTDETYEAEIGKQYELTYQATKPGYYFVNWSYSTTISPFIGTNEIVMPDKNLEVMALFSPIPEPIIPDPENPEDPIIPQKGHSIDFMAEPPEGGSIPEDLGDIKPGSKVTIGVTPNKGWEFAYWYFKNDAGEIIEVESYWNPDGSGYFIMPDENVKAIAVFKKAGRYKLYVTYTLGGEAWVMDGKEKTTLIPEAIAENIYDLGYEAKDGYKFVGWEFRWDKYGENEGVQPYIYQDQNKAVMPYSDMTVTAKFEKEKEGNGPYKIRVISNNYIWGNAWIEVNGEEKTWRQEVNGTTEQNASNEDGIVIEAGKEYKVGYKAEEGYVYTNWLPVEYFIESYFDNVNEGYGIIRIPEEKLTKDIELVAYFKPGEGNIDDNKGVYMIGVKSANYFRGDALIYSTDPYFPLNAVAAGYRKALEQGEKEYYSAKDFIESSVNNSVNNFPKLPFKPDTPYFITGNPSSGYEFKSIKLNEEDLEKYKVNLSAFSLEEIKEKYITAYTSFSQTVTKLDNSEAYEKLIDKAQMATAEMFDLNMDSLFEDIDSLYEDIDSIYTSYDVNGIKIDRSMDIAGVFDGGYIWKIEAPKDAITKDAEFVLDFKSDDIPEPGPGPGPIPPNEFFIKVEIEGLGDVKDADGNNYPNGVIIEMEDGDSITLTATPADGYEFVGWMVDDEFVSNEKTHTFKINGKSITVKAVFEKIDDDDNDPYVDDFKIISIRDLRWQKYFVNGNSTTGKVIYMPKEDKLMIEDYNYPEVLKMGYAVEFELTTSQLPPEKTKLVITPHIIHDGYTIDWEDVEDDMAGGKEIADYFKKIEINGTGIPTDWTSKFQTSRTLEEVENNGVNINQIRWNWLYYLPAQIYFNDIKDDDITIKFDIELWGYNDNTKKYEVKEDYILFEKTHSGSKWEGDVFKYSKDQSVLDDIYNNAQN